MAQAFDLTDLGTALGAKCQDDTVKTGFLSAMMFNPSFENKVTVLTGVIDEIPLPNMVFADPSAPMADAENITYKTGIITADADILKVKDCIIATKINPWKLWPTYMGQMAKEAYKAKQLGKDFFAMPFEDFVLQKLKEKASEQFYLKALFLGVRNNAGTSSSDLFDGFNKKITDRIAATRLTPETTGVINSSNVVASLKAVARAQSEANQGQTTNIHVNSNIFDMYADKLSILTNPAMVATDVAAQIAQPRLNAIPVAGTNAILQREPGMGTSQRIICTTPDHLFLGFNADPNTMTFEVQKVDLTLKLIMVYKAGVELGLDSEISVNEQE